MSTRHKHTKPSSKRVKVILIISLCAVLLAGVGAGAYFRFFHKTSAKTATNTPISLASYQKVNDGMTYQEVTKILGSTGSVTTSSGKREGATSLWVYLYCGKSGDSKAVITFRGGKVAGKTSLGLQ